MFSVRSQGVSKLGVVPSVLSAIGISANCSYKKRQTYSKEKTVGLQQSKPEHALNITPSSSGSCIWQQEEFVVTRQISTGKYLRFLPFRDRTRAIQVVLPTGKRNIVFHSLKISICSFRL
jgi:hypothetical protein